MSDACPIQSVPNPLDPLDLTVRIFFGDQGTKEEYRIYKLRTISLFFLWPESCLRWKRGRETRIIGSQSLAIFIFDKSAPRYLSTGGPESTSCTVESFLLQYYGLVFTEPVSCPPFKLNLQRNNFVARACTKNEYLFLLIVG